MKAWIIGTGLLVVPTFAGCSSQNADGSRAKGPLEGFIQGFTQNARAKEQEIELMKALTEQTQASVPNPYEPNTPDWAEFELRKQQNLLLQLQQWQQHEETRQQQEDAANQGLRPNAYGQGVHKNRYGQPITLRPDFGGVPGEHLQIKENAYGPGIHADQYGRPVREYSWPDGKPLQ